MPVNVTAQASLAPELRVHYVRRMLYTAQPQLLYNKAGWVNKTKIPVGEGDTAKFRRWSNLPLATTPLTEGITPGGATLTVSEVSKQVAQYGNYLMMSDKVRVTSIDTELMASSEVIGRNAGQTIDRIVRAAYVQSTNVIYAGTGNTSDNDIAAGDVLNDAGIKFIVRNLDRGDAQRFGDPQNGNFIGICHPDVYDVDLMGLDAFKLTGFYQKADQIEQGRVPMTYGVKWYKSTFAYTTVNASSVPIYYSFIFGPDAIGSIDIEELDLQMIMKALGSGGTSDALNQRATMGWKTTAGAIILNDAFIVKYVSTATTP